MGKFCSECGAAKKTGRTIVNYILDESGSMQSLVSAAVSGFNEYVGELRKSEGDTLLSLTKFNTATEVVHTLTPLSDVPEMTDRNYVPNGMTALYDAIGKTVRAIESEVTSEDRVLCVIMTDGAENASREFNQQGIKSLIESKEKEGNWSFIYLGANQDAFAVGASMGVNVGNIANYAATVHGHSHAMRGVSRASAMYLSSDAKSTQDFFAGDAGELLKNSADSDVQLSTSK